ncbi:TPA: HD domain-containing protein, partial [Legionella pneumophila]|nr:HD domain-containing protein [Legionella pneumophila]
MKKDFIINDPIHKLMLFRNNEARLVNSIINTTSFQRLRHIKQLGMSYLVYPGANHTRFSHCLGAAYIGKRVIEKLRADQDTELSEMTKLYAIAAGLLHDIGHGPFSHIFELNYNGFEFSHEEMGSLLAKKISKEIDDDFQTIIQEIAILLDKNNMNDGVKLSAEAKFVKTLISSQLDTDRMDYLLRDSHFCGVDYGEYDIKWLINGIKYCPKKNIIAINRKAIGVIEHYLIARRLMTNCVYKHKKVTAATHLLSTFLITLHKNIEEFINNPKYSSLPIVQFFKAISKDTQHLNILEEFLSITDSDIDLIIKMVADEKNKKINLQLKKLAQKLLTRQIPKTYEIDFSRYTDANQIVTDWKEKNSGIVDWQVCLEDRNISTYKSNSLKNKEDESIYVVDSNDNIKSIDYFSLPIFSFSNKIEINPVIMIDKGLEDNSLGKQLLK